MKKAIIMLCTAGMLAGAAFSEAPELKNMMPNSWKKLMRLSEAEERDVLEAAQVKSDTSTLMSRDRFLARESRVYKESVNGVEFYRVLSCNKAIPDFLAEDYKDRTMIREDYDDFISHKMQQVVYIKETSGKLTRLTDLKFRQFGATTGNHETEASAYFVFEDLFIKKLNKNEIGFFITKAAIGFQLPYNDDPVDLIYGKTKSQQAGSNSCRFFKIKNDADIAAALEECKKDFRYGISIDSSSYLFDPKCPLRYSIQNAFDGDPATSYVENTEDDLFEIKIHIRQYHPVFAVINGYSSNNMLYKYNNRVKLFNHNYNLEDNNLKYQIVKAQGNAYFIVKEIYKGEKYNDTCISELNVKFDNDSWLFGEIDE